MVPKDGSELVQHFHRCTVLPMSFVIIIIEQVIERVGVVVIIEIGEYRSHPHIAVSAHRGVIVVEAAPIGGMGMLLFFSHLLFFFSLIIIVIVIIIE